MTAIRNHLNRAAEEVLAGRPVRKEDALQLMRLDTWSGLRALMLRAGRITKNFNGSRASFCAILNAKSGLCWEDCSFCAQSLRFDSKAERYPLLDPGPILEKAHQAEKIGCREFCLVTSGKSLTSYEFERLLEIVRQIRAETRIQVDVSVGFLNEEEARKLKAAGVARVNHNLQSSSRFYPRIVTTHSQNDRIATLNALRDAGLEICSGVILGLGETAEDRVEAAFQLETFRPECVPINLLDPRPGTPLGQRGLLSPFEILKTIAVFRLILPRTNLRLAGGRHLQLGSFQRLALRAGINGLIVGDYLTTSGGPMEEDFTSLRKAGYDL